MRRWTAACTLQAGGLTQEKPQRDNSQPHGPGRGCLLMLVAQGLSVALRLSLSPGCPQSLLRRRKTAALSLLAGTAPPAPLAVTYYPSFSEDAHRQQTLGLNVT